RLRRFDRFIDFWWQDGSPDPALEPDSFSVRWTGQLLPPVTGQYTFTVLSDDGVRLWIDGEPVVDDWTAHPLGEASGTIALEAGVRVGIRLEYFDETGQSVVQLAWTPPDRPREVIPQNHLFYTRLDPPTLVHDAPGDRYTYAPAVIIEGGTES